MGLESSEVRRAIQRAIDKKLGSEGKQFTQDCRAWTEMESHRVFAPEGTFNVWRQFIKSLSSERDAVLEGRHFRVTCIPGLHQPSSCCCSIPTRSHWYSSIQR